MTILRGLSVRRLAERAYFSLSLGLGLLLRASRYSSTRIVSAGADTHARKWRARYAPLLIWLSRPLMWLLDTGVRVLPTREWVHRERLLYHTVYGSAVRADSTGVVLPLLPGRTLAALLEDPTLGERDKRRGVALAATALLHLHQRGITHGDAMADNVMVDLDAGVARCFDFETIHEPRRPMGWRRADDLRALLLTCARRTEPGALGALVEDILAHYADADVHGCVADGLSSVWRRALAFHLGQAPLPFNEYRSVQRAVRSAVAAMQAE